ncbi:MAG TPA: peptidylprolyl isomerase [Patescibacteria group bacterium]|nr:peptidylprolyl isomerase [Patescibacteria group bacterium]
MPHAHHWKAPGPRMILMIATLLMLGLAAVPAYSIPPPLRSASADSVRADTAATDGDSTGESTETPAHPRIGIELEKGGTIVIELLSDQAPRAVERILALVREKFYDGLEFHRVESYLVQTGRNDSELPPVEGEMFGQRIRHETGMVGMARLPDDYDSATTQFYIMKEDRPRLNDEYTLFGRVVQGMDRVMQIRKGWKIETITVLP